MENVGFIILRIGILAVLIFFGSLLYEWVRDKMQENELTFKDLIFNFFLVIATIIFAILMIAYWGWAIVSAWNG
jgi:hypothetical protein